MVLNFYHLQVFSKIKQNIANELCTPDEIELVSIAWRFSDKKLKFYNKWILTLTSGMLFGITHGNDIIIWMFSSVAGFMLMAWFIHFKKCRFFGVFF